MVSKNLVQALTDRSYRSSTTSITRLPSVFKVKLKLLAVSLSTSSETKKIPLPPHLYVLWPRLFLLYYIGNYDLNCIDQRYSVVLNVNQYIDSSYWICGLPSKNDLNQGFMNGTYFALCLSLWTVDRFTSKRKVFAHGLSANMFNLILPVSLPLLKRLTR
jgi:hypothetical protein